MKGLILLLLLAVPFLNYGQGKRSDPSLIKGVRFSVEVVGSRRFRREDSIPVKFRFKNTNKSRVYFFKHLGFGPGGFRVTILDANNKQPGRTVIAESFPPPLRSKEDFQAIEPGKSFEDRFTVDLMSYDIEPGDYSLIVSFLSPIPAASDVPSGLTVLTSDDFFEVKPIRFKVVP
jgi:hypothetical protein